VDHRQRLLLWTGARTRVCAACVIRVCDMCVCTPRANIPSSACVCAPAACACLALWRQQLACALPTRAYPHLVAGMCIADSRIPTPFVAAPRTPSVPVRQSGHACTVAQGLKSGSAGSELLLAVVVESFWRRPRGPYVQIVTCHARLPACLRRARRT